MTFRMEEDLSRVIILYGNDRICSIDIWDGDNRYVLHRWLNDNFKNSNIDFEKTLSELNYDGYVIRIVGVDCI